MKNEDFLNLDWEKEYDKDYIFLLEARRDLIESEQKEEALRKPAKIRVEFNKNVHETRTSSFRRTFKKVLHFRSHLHSDSY